MYLIAALLISMNLVTAYRLILTIIILISVTFRKMDKTKRPHNIKLNSDLQNIKSSDFSDAYESYHTYKKIPL
ncbi:hypothetical protein IEQ34_011990 [Dendrobium chrysotoxum]|uniref:Uncharacterized protein n=1 Tax=Dendrobium chrysotoxum TaxID=161865 RepID=A0AAV7GRD1_DENCH|nr:hypothetical protein IEQ34_011990 [Dendrobium chrysotoxum]